MEDKVINELNGKVFWKQNLERLEDANVKK